MAGPFDVELIAEVEAKWYLLADEFIDNDPVIDAVNGNLAAFRRVVELAAALANIADIDEGNAAVAPREEKIRESLLIPGIDFEENYVFRVVSVEQSFPEELEI